MSKRDKNMDESPVKVPKKRVKQAISSDESSSEGDPIGSYFSMEAEHGDSTSEKDEDVESVASSTDNSNQSEVMSSMDKREILQKILNLDKRIQCLFDQTTSLMKCREKYVNVFMSK